LQVFGRTDRFYLKQFEQETNLKAYIVLDKSASMGYAGEGGITKLQYGCYLAAVLAYLLVRQQDSVGLAVFDDHVVHRVPSHSTPVHMNMILKMLEDIEPGNRTRASDVLNELAEYYKKRTLIIVISDLYDDAKELSKALAHLRHRKHEVVLFHVFDEHELKFPYDKLTEFVDLESKERLQIDPKYVRDEYLNELRNFISFFRRSSTENNFEYIVTDTSIPYDFMLSAYLARRRKIT